MLTRGLIARMVGVARTYWHRAGTVGTDDYDVFISYSRADARYAADIDLVLRQKGVRTFFDQRNLATGLDWVRALEEAIGAAKTAVILLGPSGLGNTQQYERELAFIRQTSDPTFPVIPVLLPDTRDPPFNFLRVVTWVDFSNVAKISDAPDQLQRLLSSVQVRLGDAEAGRLDICPYRGLDAFREEDSAFFFGRGSASDAASPIGELVGKVRDHGFVMVVGPSGNGKSSLVYAGLVPALRRARDRFWTVLSFKPGDEPLQAIAEVFNPKASDEGAAAYARKIREETDALRNGHPDLLADMVRQYLQHAEGKPDRLLLYVDQWEELYAQTLTPSAVERPAQRTKDVTCFIDLLLNAARSAPVTVVATIRADFYAPLISNSNVRTLLPTQQVLLGSMTPAELERTIVEPAKMVGLAFDPPTLVQRILEDAGEDIGMLPLLQYALKETWDHREGNRLTGDSYTRSGGVREAIRITAERTFEALSPTDQQAARQLFLRLVTPGEGQEDTRARAPMPQDQTQRKIVEQFADRRTRLLVTGFDQAKRPTVEVAHEALIRRWPRLRDWINANRERLRARAAILQAQTEWEQNGRRRDLLLPSGFQLERARTLLEEPGDLVVDDIQEFIALSSANEKEAEKRQRNTANTFHRLLSYIRRYNLSLMESDPELAEEVRDLGYEVRGANEALPLQPADEMLGLESIAMRTQRPVLAIRDNVTQLVFIDEADSKIWGERLTKAKPLLDIAIPAVGRIDLTGAPLDWAGTGWLVAENIIVTNRHVAREFAERKGDGFAFKMGVTELMGGDLDFLQEIDNPERLVFKLIRPLHIEEPPGPDVSFFEIEMVSGDARLANPIELASTMPPPEQLATLQVATIGYPAYDSRIPEPDLMERIYGKVYNKKRLAPGGVTRLDDALLWHNCTTLGGNPGSVVFDLNSGRALGLHFSGSFLVTNYAVRADVVKKLLTDVRAS